MFRYLYRFLENLYKLIMQVIFFQNVYSLLWYLVLQLLLVKIPLRFIKIKLTFLFKICQPTNFNEHLKLKEKILIPYFFLISIFAKN